jgi:hypothetical protein
MAGGGSKRAAQQNATQMIIQANLAGLEAENRARALEEDRRRRDAADQLAAQQREAERGATMQALQQSQAAALEAIRSASLMRDGGTTADSRAANDAAAAAGQREATAQRTGRASTVVAGAMANARETVGRSVAYPRLQRLG